MTEVANTITASATTAAAGMTTTADRRGIRVIRWMVAINLVLVALQPISAGFFLSGYGRAVTVHASVALALQVGTLIQAVTGIILWRRRRVPPWVAGISVGLFAIVFLQSGLGHTKRYWLHVPIGVGIYGGLTRVVTRLDSFRRRPGSPV